jgi:hypothetical protein
MSNACAVDFLGKNLWYLTETPQRAAAEKYFVLLRARETGKRKGGHYSSPWISRFAEKSFYRSYAADAVAARRFGAGASSPSQRTLTIFDTPGSCIVTPYSTLPVSIVLRLCVTMINCV